MKKYCLIILLVLTTNSIAFGEAMPISQGSGILSGSGSLSSAKGSLYGQDEVNIVLSTAYHYFFFNHFSVGSNMGLVARDQSANSLTTFNIGPCFAYYLGDTTKSSFPYFACGVNWDVSDGEKYYSGTDAFLGCGMLLEVTKNIGFSLEIDYITTNLKFANNKDILNGKTLAFVFGISGLFY